MKKSTHENAPEKECCGTCNWYYHESGTDGGVCANGYYAEFVKRKDACEKWEEKR